MIWVATVMLLSLIFAPVVPAAAIDLNGRWRFDSGGFPPAVIVTITQTGTALSIPLGVPYTGSIGSPDASGFTSYSVSWTDGTNLSGFGGRITPSGNLLDGRGGSLLPPNPPSAGGVVATRCSCFDGNENDGDGCDAACQVEPCWTCVGDPSVCTPTLDGGACEDGAACTTGETCTAGVCGGGSPVVPCFDMSGSWTRHHSVPGLGIDSHTMTTISQVGTDLRIDGYVGTIDLATGAFDVRQPNLNLFCWSFDPLIGTVAADGLTYSASGATQEPQIFAPDHCDQFAATEIGDHCGDGDFDGVEQCDDGNLAAGDGCSPFCEVEPCWLCSGAPSACMLDPGQPCDDNDGCTINDTCAGDGSCSGSPLVCDPCLACVGGMGCVAQPEAACKASTGPEKSLLHLKESAEDGKDRFSWRWSKGDDTAPGELGNPPDVTLCIYDESTSTTGLLFRATMPGTLSWNSTASGFRFKDPTAAGSDGVFIAQLRSGEPGKASAKLKGKGIHLSDRPYPLPAPQLPLPLRVQLQGENGLCLETVHDASGVLMNDPARGVFKARGTP